MKEYTFCELTTFAENVVAQIFFFKKNKMTRKMCSKRASVEKVRNCCTEKKNLVLHNSRMTY